MPPPPTVAPPANSSASPAAPPPILPARTVTIRTTAKDSYDRVALYGLSGLGKTSLMMAARHAGLNPVIIDVDGSVDKLGHAKDIPRVTEIDSFDYLRAVVNDPSIKDYGLVSVDSGTTVQDLITAELCRRDSVESLIGVAGGWGAGYRQVYEKFLILLSDLDQHVAQGRHVALVCHEVTTDAPNADGENYTKYDLDLLQTKSISVRARVKAWADHVLFLQLDKTVAKGKVTSGSSRTIHCLPNDAHAAKSRTLTAPLVIEGPEDPTLWQLLFNKGK